MNHEDTKTPSKQLPVASDQQPASSEASSASSGPRLSTLDPRPAAAPQWWQRAWRDIEREAIERTLADCGGNKRATARRLKISRRSLYDKLRHFALRDAARIPTQSATRPHVQRLPTPLFPQGF